MGSPFMPSVASSLNAGSRDNLLDLLQQRLLQQQMQQQLFAQQRQGQQDLVGTAMRFQSGKLAQDRFAAGEKAKADKASADAAEAAAKARAEGNVAGARDMFFEGLTRGEGLSPALLRTASEGKVPVSMLPKPAPPTPEQERAETFRKTKDRVDARNAFDPKATKVAKGPKDSAKLPAGVKAALKAKKGQPGWTKATEAMQSVGKYWDSFLGDHPDLDRDAVRAYISNVYNERLTPTMVQGASESSSPSALGAGAMDRINALRKAKGLPPL